MNRINKYDYYLPSERYVSTYVSNFVVDEYTPRDVVQALELRTLDDLETVYKFLYDFFHPLDADMLSEQIANERKLEEGELIFP